MTNLVPLSNAVLLAFLEKPLEVRDSIDAVYEAAMPYRLAIIPAFKNMPLHLQFDPSNSSTFYNAQSPPLPEMRALIDTHPGMLTVI